MVQRLPSVEGPSLFWNKNTIWPLSRNSALIPDFPKELPQPVPQTRALLLDLVWKAIWPWDGAVLARLGH